MVEVVGLFGQTSPSTATFKVTSEFFPSVESGLPTMLMMLQPKCFNEGSSLVTSTVGDENKKIIWGYHPQISMKGFCGINEKGGCSGGGKRGGHLLSNKTGFTHTGNNGASFAEEDKVNGVIELTIDTRGHELQRFGLRFEGVYGN